MSKPLQDEKCDADDCGCSGPLSRRQFVEVLGWGTAAALTAGTPVMAGPFEAAPGQSAIPADKKLTPQWVESLTARGARTVYRGAGLTKIGMPIGGICTGQLYLGGDGRLWRWDIFNQHHGTGDKHYSQPPAPDYPVPQGFAIQTTSGGQTRDWPLAAGGFSEISFIGEYPIGQVEYRDAHCPVAVSLEAFSPFIPLDAEDSHLPATVMRWTLKNTSPEKVTCRLSGWLQNAVCRHSEQAGSGRRNQIARGKEFIFLDCHMAPPAAAPAAAPRPDIVVEEFQQPNYEGWEVQGTAFGKGPIQANQVPSYQGDLGAPTARVVNSHAAAPGAEMAAKDAAVGRLTSKPLMLERHFITFWIGGGNHPRKTCVNLLVDDKVVRTATGHNSNRMRQETFDVRDLAGKTARLEIVDEERGGWGNIGAAKIVQSDKPAAPTTKLQDREDFGSMGLALLDAQDGDLAWTTVVADKLPLIVAGGSGDPQAEAFDRPPHDKLVGALSRKLVLEPGQQATVTFVVAWHFANIRHLGLGDTGGRKYGKRFSSARAVAEYVAENLPRLSAQTKLWHDTWYDSTLPYWFLDRTLLNISILATNTAYWLANDRFYGWEGVGCCQGTCCHVWHYAQAVGRLFPSIERHNREAVDYGLSFNVQSGVIAFRGEFDRGLAVDAQAGTILRALREHQMAPDDAFLKRTWPRIRKSIECLIDHDPNRDGILDGAQMNTLDQPWFGQVAWLSSLYVAALRAGEQMAREVGDDAFAAQAAKLAMAGTRNIDAHLFNGEYYYQTPDPQNRSTVGSFDGCEIDQVLGQSWAFQLGLPERVLPKEHTKIALKSLWKYNFAPDVGPFRAAQKAGRWYAMSGEAGLLMCSWPRGDKARQRKGFDFYFNECMNGFEYQAAGHMLWEGMVQEGLAITRAIHDRYHAARRNPWNEVECGDHYARSMASYGVFLAACGYEYHGPRGYLAFAPRLTPDNFRAAFTTAEGWGSFQQRREGAVQRERIELKWGRLLLRTLAFTIPEAVKPGKVTVQVAGKPVGSRFTAEKGRVRITLAAETLVKAGEAMQVEIA